MVRNREEGVKGFFLRYYVHGYKELLKYIYQISRFLFPKPISKS